MNKVQKKAVENPLEAIALISSAIGQKLTCSKCGSREQKIALSSLQRELDDLKQVNICRLCCTLDQLENFIGKKQVEERRKEWEAKLQKLEVNPLSVAKYFYENWKVTDPAIMQRLIYFAYLEILKEKYIVLFEEKFQAWPGGPVLESVIYPMYKHCETLENFFEKIKYLDNPIVIQFLNKIAERYVKLEDFQIYKKARNKLWEEFRQNLTNEGESRPIEESKAFTFFLYQKQNQRLTIHSS